MRQENFQLPQPSGPDRPGDHWIDHCVDGTPKPVLTWAGWRRRALLLMTATTLLIVFAFWMWLPASLIFKPGELSTPHAQILAGTLTQERCAACHIDSSLSPIAWLRATFRSTDEAHRDRNASDLCMKCHQQSISSQYATTAHNLPLSYRDQLSQNIQLASQGTGQETFLNRFSLQDLIPAAAVDQNDVQCGVCHQEHQGRRGDLLSMSDAQCQSCHSQRFGAFAKSHPDWNAWPYGRGGQIVFDHGSHRDKHFAKASASDTPGFSSFDCATCHPVAGAVNAGSLATMTRSPGSPSVLPISDEIVRTASYEHACASCHAAALELQSASGLDLLALPIVPDSIAQKLTANSNSSWPVEATGYPDGVISPLTELLLRSDPEVSTLMRQVPDGDFSRLDPDDPKTMDILHQLAVEHRELVLDLGREGHVAFSRRLRRLGIPDQAVASVLRTLPPQLLESASEKWFGDSQTDATLVELSPIIRQVMADDQDSLLLGDDLLTADPSAVDRLEKDPLAIDPLANDPLENVPNTVPSATQVDQTLQFGGWHRDDTRLSIHYRGSGHTDPVLVGLVATFAHLKEGDPLRKRFFALPAVAACVECHATADSIIPQWTTKSLVGRKSEFTKFSHRPHLNVSGLGSCVYCHQVNPEAETTNDFQPLARETCAACHLPHAAGDNCTTCHRYHLHPASR